MIAFQGNFASVVRVAHNGQVREYVETKSGPFSAAFLIHDPKKDQVILVKQRREAMLAQIQDGQIVELPAGRADHKESIKALIAREASEEAGAQIEESQIEMLNFGQPLALSPGILVEMMYLAYIELLPGQLSDDRVFGVPEEGEEITRILVSTDEFLSMECQDMKTWALQQELRYRLLRQTKRDKLG